MLSHKIRNMLVLAGFAVALGVATVGGSAVAAASSGATVAVSPPGTVDSDGTQGSFTQAIQGAQDDDGDQDAHATGSWEAVPQDKPHS